MSARRCTTRLPSSFPMRSGAKRRRHEAPSCGVDNKAVEWQTERAAAAHTTRAAAACPNSVDNELLFHSPQLESPHTQTVALHYMSPEGSLQSSGGGSSRMLVLVRARACHHGKMTKHNVPGNNKGSAGSRRDAAHSS